MKLTTEVEKEIKLLMDDYWNSYFEGNLEHWANYLVDDYRNIGGTEEEIWNSKKEILDYTYRVIDQMKGTSELRNKQTQIIPYDPYVMVHELLDIYIKIENEWTFYQKFRLSSLIQKTTKGWKVLHQHGSYPDSKTTEGEAFAFDTLKSENRKLQKAIKERTIELEEKNRELSVEAALERVRARTMAMQRSEELHETSQILFQQMKELGEPVEQLTIGIVKETEKVVEVFATVLGSQLQQTFRHSIDEPTVMNKIYRGWKEQKKSLLIEMYSDDIQVYNRYRNQLVKSEMFSTTISKDERRIIYAAYFSKGMLALGSNTNLSEESHRLLERFAGVFDGIYTRFLNLQKAEEQTREAKIELGLERVRARAMAMHSSEELKDAAILLYHELKSLGVTQFINCGYVLIEEATNLQHAWMTHADGTIRDAHQMPLTGDNVMNERYENWKKNVAVFCQQVGGKQLKNHLQFVSSHINYSGGKGDITLPDPTFFYCANFSEGYLHLLATEKLSTEAELTISRFTSVFEITYRRFLDLQKAEAQAEKAKQHLIQIQSEKNRAESALAELKSTQAQLIQSEKMASLGELTAGIAHEIQNPLNFVNNFSEVNLELIDEMKTELKQGNTSDALEISEMLGQNLQKVAHHGKRADGIVKSMMQHSSNNSGQKVPVDINALVDEYLRLSYHGLRAKDKSFNAIMQTHFDSSIGKINIVGQDIGRVLLNLFNNAFYSVTERKKLNFDTKGKFEPTVTVSTEKIQDTVVLKVADNGVGIREKLLDKIYQPFFTTKPTGEGTGLGLSLSYDIITKGHNGEMQVETKEGEGATFIIRIPTNNSK